MTRPGNRLRRIASRLCSARTMARLIDPVVADLQVEHADAVRGGRVWRSRWVRVTGYGAFLKVVAVHGCSQTVQFALDSTSEDHLTLRRTLAVAAAVAVTVTVVVQILLLSSVPGDWTEGKLPALIVYLIPASLPLGVPVGLALAIFWSFGGRVVSRRLTLAALTIAVVCSISSFVTNGWIAPASNQAFRVAVSGNPHVQRGDRELTFGELRRYGRFDPDLARLYYLRLSVSCAPFVLVLFAVAAARRRTALRWILAFLATGVFLAPFLAGREPPWYGLDSALVAAWLPNTLLIAASALLLVIPKPEITNRGSRITN